MIEKNSAVLEDSSLRIDFQLLFLNSTIFEKFRRAF